MKTNKYLKQWIISNAIVTPFFVWAILSNNVGFQRSILSLLWILGVFGILGGTMIVRQAAFEGNKKRVEWWASELYATLESVYNMLLVITFIGLGWWWSIGAGVLHFMAPAFIHGEAKEQLRKMNTNESVFE